MTRWLRNRQKLGKYRIEKRLAEGGFAAVYRAFDTIEGLQVALKVPYADWTDSTAVADFRREVQLSSRLEHPHILPIKNADVIERRFVIAYPLGAGTLTEWLARRRALPTIVSYAGQLLSAVAYAHERRIVHCDLKPDNIILFPGQVLRLTDFGVAKVALRTLAATGSGTLGYLAPEHALGRPSFRSDVFSLGLILYEMLSGHVPEWPFHWPPERMDRVRRRVTPEFIAFLQRALRLDQYQRFEDATQMQAAFQRLDESGSILQSPLRAASARRRKKAAASSARRARA